MQKLHTTTIPVGLENLHRSSSEKMGQFVGKYHYFLIQINFVQCQYCNGSINTLVLKNLSSEL